MATCGINYVKGLFYDVEIKNNEPVDAVDDIRGQPIYVKDLAEFIKKVIDNEKKTLGEICYNIVSDNEILEINQKYLNHHFFTDIITFDNSFVNIINGDIFISFETVKTNSKLFNVELLTEFYRVIIHGIMHLCGYKDATKTEKIQMRALEEKYIAYLEEL